MLRINVHNPLRVKLDWSDDIYENNFWIQPAFSKYLEDFFH